MAISRKPGPARPTALSDKEVDALINKGGSVANPQSSKKEKPDITPVALRVPTELIDRIEVALKDRPVKMPRHTWIMEAIVEKLERESK